jgi:DHA1 family bicyclomycin/chloramphenicol resistance-like MFS transporter
MKWHPLWVIAYLTGLISSGHISTNMYAPSLPAMAVYFDAPAAQVQATVSLFLVAFALGQLVYGPLSDRFGRRDVLIGGLVLYLGATVGSIVLATLFPSVDILIVCRVLQALGACAGPVIGRAITRDLYSREDTARMMAHVVVAMGLAPAFAPVLGGYLEEWFDWRVSFVVDLPPSEGAIGMIGSRGRSGRCRRRGIRPRRSWRSCDKSMYCWARASSSGRR